MCQNYRILIVDDDQGIRDLLVRRLKTYGFDAVAVECGKDMADELAIGGYCLVILDVMLRGENGLALCKELRAGNTAFQKVPVIFLSALDDTVDKIVGLEVGGDDYLPKPFETRELVARINAIMRRVEGQDKLQNPTLTTSGDDRSPSALPIIRFGEWRLNTGTRYLVDPEGLILPMSAAEYRLLTFFLKHPQQVLTRDQLVDHIASRTTDIYDRSLDSQISRLRSKLGDNARSPKLILTMRGDGYMLAATVTYEAGEDL